MQTLTRQCICTEETLDYLGEFKMMRICNNNNHALQKFAGEDGKRQDSEMRCQA